MESNKKAHWENVFATKGEKEVSWYQQYPKTSVDFFIKNNIDKNAKIIEIGGGDSYLIDALLDLGYTDLTILDISENAIKRLKNRLGDKARNINFLVSDVLDFQSNKKFDVWHDRASFHFLTTKSDIKKYTSIVSTVLVPNGNLFLGTFSENGPLKCSGLEITQYSENKIKTVFESDFQIENCFHEDHQTPFETIQNFIFCSLKKK